MRSSSSKALHKRKARSPTPSENSDIDSDKSTTNGGDSERSLPLLKTRLLTLKKSYKARSSMLKSLKNDTLSRMKIQSSSSLAQAAQRESNHGYKKRRIASEQSGPSSSHSATVSSRRAVSAETISLSGPKKTNVFNGQELHGLRVSVIAIALWQITYENAENPRQQLPYPRLIGRSGLTDYDVTMLEERQLAVVDEDVGFLIPKDLSCDELMDLLKTHFPTVFQYLQRAIRSPNPAYNPLYDHESLAFLPPVLLCLKNGRNYNTYPGRGGTFPDGNLIWKKCVSKNRLSWKDNKVVFCARTDITAAAEEWLLGKCPFPPTPQISEVDSESSDSEGAYHAPGPDKGKGKERERSLSTELRKDVRKLRKTNRFVIPSSDGFDESGIAREDEDSQRSDGDFPGMADAIEQSIKERSDRTTRSMNKTATTFPISVHDTSDDSDEADVNAVASDITVLSSPVRPDFVAQANSTSFLIHDKIMLPSAPGERKFQF
ncbi:MAG: hypothetical protein NXY57DRAFT_960960 [Lentinula lateritia]|nr:MAG: hypothetical protein NXY57DRAFT_960960 [Lentinula lateritia]